jgi:MFS family permease
MLPQLEGKSLLFGTTASCGLGFMLFGIATLEAMTSNLTLLTLNSGYDQGVFGGLLSNPDFLRTFNNPGTTLQGQIVSTYTIGCIFGAILSLCIGDILGRRRSVALGCALVGVGGILQATAFHLPHMIIGRIIGGLGIGVNTTTIPMFQSETCKPSLRGKLVSVQLTFLVFGFVLTNWMNFGFTYIPNNPVSWRFPLGFQSALAIGTVFLLPMLAESPRWLCLKDRQQEAEVVLSRLVAKPIDDPEVQDLLHVMVITIARERADGQITWREVFHNGSQQTFRRILLGAGTSFMQQIGGVNIGKITISLPNPVGSAESYCLTIQSPTTSLSFSSEALVSRLDCRSSFPLAIRCNGCSGRPWRTLSSRE